MAVDNIFYSQSNKSRDDLVASKEKPVVPRSVFPFGSERITLLNEGALYPIDKFFVLPGDSLDIEQASLLSVFNPFVDRMFSGMRLYFHWYYQKCEHEWKGWKNFATRGRRGNIKFKVPEVDLDGFSYLFDGLLITDTSDSHFLTVHHNLSTSLCGYLAHLAPIAPVNQPSIFPAQIHIAGNLNVSSLLDRLDLGLNSQVNRSFRLEFQGTLEQVHSLFPGLNPSLHLNAIPFAMYQRIYRDFYLNQNLCRNNPLWFPDDEDDFTLGYLATTVKSLNSDSILSQNKAFSVVPNNNTEILPSASPALNKRYADSPILGALRYRQFDGDAFTTAQPFLERNGTTQLRTYVDAINPTSTVGFYGSLYGHPSQNSDIGITLGYSGTPIDHFNGFAAPGTSSSLRAVDSNNAENIIVSVLNMNQLRELAAATAWSERNARADGDYNSLIFSHYSVNPDSEDRSAKYIGGCVQRVEFSEVLQTSESANTPLGSQVARAYSGGASKIGHFEVPDFGYVMCLASLVPDTFYTQGLDLEDDSALTGADLPWPEFSNLQKEGLPRKRLYFTDTPGDDNALFGYIERDLLFKYRPNRLLGHLLDSQDSKFRSLTFARFFEGLGSSINLNNEFVTMTSYNLRKDMFSVPVQPHFVLQFGSNIRLVRCLPYVTKDSSLTNIL